MSENFADRNRARRQALVALLLVVLPNLVLVGEGLLMRGQAQQAFRGRFLGRDRHWSRDNRHLRFGYCGW